jgi:hypothetical protein
LRWIFCQIGTTARRSAARGRRACTGTATWAARALLSCRRAAPARAGPCRPQGRRRVATTTSPAPQSRAPAPPARPAAPPPGRPPRAARRANTSCPRGSSRGRSSVVSRSRRSQRPRVDTSAEPPPTRTGWRNLEV